MTLPHTSPDTVELWLVELEKCAEALEDLERQSQRLAADERERAHAISNVRDRRHRLATDIALRVLLERFAGADVRCRPFVRSLTGKPSLGIGGVEFSLSHVDGLALIGLSLALPLGVDLERTRPVKMSMSRLVEITAVGAGLSDKPLPALCPERTFLQAWARLEAFTKARGRGLAQTLVDVGMRGQASRRLSPVELEARTRRAAHDARITVHDVKLLPSLHGAVGVPRGTGPLRARAFPADHAGIVQLLAHAG